MDDNIISIITPTLSVNNGVAAVDFYKQAFQAIEIMRVSAPDGTIVAELRIGDARFFVADAPVDPAPRAMAIRLGLLVADPDRVAKDAINAGATEIYPVADQEYGYRLGHIVDPFGHNWEIYRPLA